ncbi:MAG: hypothetical protein ABIR32_05420, partial [Ilumatobacteraceae bacterium]
MATASVSVVATTVSSEGSVSWEDSVSSVSIVPSVLSEPLLLSEEHPTLAATSTHSALKRANF